MTHDRTRDSKYFRSEEEVLDFEKDRQVRLEYMDRIEAAMDATLLQLKKDGYRHIVARIEDMEKAFSIIRSVHMDMCWEAWVQCSLVNAGSDSNGPR